jgi:hypothetical protein
MLKGPSACDFSDWLIRVFRGNVGNMDDLLLHPTRRLASRARNGCQPSNLFVGHRQFDRLSPSCHDVTPRS